ncbi:RAB6-interacting golgin [Hyla sarda]|uniref:RAB6-interacting golgin n=1 Tax=Hyla sarda TaxID=327740 RepID=UPI0024C250D0|nr:RAB6-interacting golgin [Hyla sarda]
MAGWAGFSEDELRRMRSRRELPDPKGPETCPPEAFFSRQQPQAKKAPVQKLAKQERVPTPQHNPSPPIQKNTPSPINLSSSTEVKKPPQDKPKKTATDKKEMPAESPSIEVEEDEELSKKEVELRDRSRLEQLQLEQRLMEEKNKRKKALLSKAITERSKKTKAEAVKLNRIQKQLQTLDDMVSTDIGILRNRIEQACLEFSQAKKRYDKAESEYVTSKLDLYKKTQIKEQLTEHLCTIIQQNELRKAKKLEELMQQLEVDTDEERLDLEIEVEQMLQLQEAEARKQPVSPTSEQSQQITTPDSSGGSPPEKETPAESDPGQDELKSQPTNDLGDTNLNNQTNPVPGLQGDTVPS